MTTIWIYWRTVVHRWQVKVVRMLYLNCLQQANTHHGSMWFELWNAQLLEGCNFVFSPITKRHWIVHLDTQEPAYFRFLCLKMDYPVWGVAEDVDLNCDRAASLDRISGVWTQPNLVIRLTILYTGLVRPDWFPHPNLFWRIIDFGGIFSTWGCMARSFQGDRRWWRLDSEPVSAWSLTFDLGSWKRSIQFCVPGYSECTFAGEFVVKVESF